MVPIDRPCTTLYWSAVVTVALAPFRIVWRSKYRDLEILVRSHWRSLAMALFDRSCTSSYSSSIV